MNLNDVKSYSDGLKHENKNLSGIKYRTPMLQMQQVLPAFTSMRIF
jgi:hypothetical protein